LPYINPVLDKRQSEMPEERVQTNDVAGNGFAPNATPPMRLGGVIAGTRVLTPDGYRPIETLQPGDPVRALLGGGPMFVPIVWIGSRNVILSRVDRSNLPVRIRKDALADGVPSRDVFMAPDHAIYLRGRLFRCADLLNGRSIVLDDRRRSRTKQYWGVVLPRHNTLLADNMAIESLLPMSAAIFSDGTGNPPDLNALFKASRQDRERVAISAEITSPPALV
jgi:hypothetical protein